MTDGNEEIRARLEQAGITQPLQQPMQPPVTRKAVRKVQRHVLGGSVLVGQTGGDDVEEMVQDETGMELRHTTVTGTCPCGGALNPAKTSYCGVCGIQLCDSCSQATCALDNCGNHICRRHRVVLAQGLILCAGHINPQALGFAAAGNATPLVNLGAASGMMLMPPSMPRAYPQLGEEVGYYCPHCGCKHSVTAMIGNQQQRCTWCDRWYTVGFAQDFGGAMRVDVLAR